MIRARIRALLERVAFRLGFVPIDWRAPPELIVFRTADIARHYGFRGDRHPYLPNVRAYWPGMGERGLRGRAFQRVTGPDDLLRNLHLRALIRSRMVTFGDSAVWIDL